MLNYIKFVFDYSKTWRVLQLLFIRMRTLLLDSAGMQTRFPEGHCQVMGFMFFGLLQEWWET